MLVKVCHSWTSCNWAGGATCLWVLFWKHWIFVQLEDCIPCALIPTCRKEILFLKPKSCISIHVLLYILYVIYNNTLLLFDKDMNKTRQLSGWRENILSIHHKVKHRQVRKKTNHSTYSHEMKILASQKICISNFVRWTFANRCIEHCIRWLLSGRCRDIRGMPVLTIFAVTCPRRVNTTPPRQTPLKKSTIAQIVLEIFKVALTKFGAPAPRKMIFTTLQQPFWIKCPP